MRGRLLALILIAAALCTPTGSDARIGGGMRGGVGSPIPCTIVAVAPSGTTFTSNILHSVVGTVSSTTAGPCAADSFSISGTDAASFELSGTTLRTSTAAGTSLNPGSFSINLIDTISGAVNSGHPFPQTLTATTPQSIGSVSLSNSTFDCTQASGTVIGAVSVIMSPTSPAFAGTLALTGTDAAHFQLSSSSLPSNLETNGTSLCSTYSINIVAQQGGMADVTQPESPAGTTGTAIALQRTINNPGASPTGNPAFVSMGHPFKAGEVPAGNKVLATLGGTSVPVTCAEPKYAIDGDLAWCHLLADISGASVSAGGAATLALTSIAGSQSTTTTRTAADWAALGDVVTLSGLTTAGVTGTTTTGTGTWTCAFDNGSTNTVLNLATSPLGRLDKVTASCTDSGNTHRNLLAVMYYWVTEKADTTLGPIQSWGPFVGNVLLHPGLSNSTLASFTYTLEFVRGGIPVRTYTQVKTPALAWAVAGDPIAARPEWTANDPGVWVSQDYATAGLTKKVPPFKAGVTYTGGSTSPQPSATVSGISGFTWTVNSLVNIFGNPNAGAAGWYPQPVLVSASVLPGGISGSTVYWAVRIGSFTFSLYDTQANALLAGATGRITPADAGSGVTVAIASAPGGTGQFDLVLGDTGGRPDLSITGEWGAAYLVGNTKAWQDLARKQAHNQATMPVFGLDGVTGLIPSLMDATNTPVGMGTALPTSYFGGTVSSSNINSGATPAGGTGGWSFSGSAVAHVPNTMYVPWIMEGSPFLRDLLVQHGNGIIALESFTPRRNAVVSGTTYYGSLLCGYGGGQVRVGAWKGRDLAEALFAAREGSAEETYFDNVLTSATAECAAYQAYKGADYQALGMIFFDETSWPLSTATIGASMQVTPFMEWYLAATLAWADLLVGDRVTELGTQANFISKWAIGLYNGDGGGYCPYYATAYVMSSSLSCYGDAKPGAYISSLAELGVGNGNGARTNYTISSTTVSDVVAPPWTLVDGDKFKPTNYDVSGGAVSHTTEPPSPFSCGRVNYFVRSPSGSNFSLSTTGAGALIASDATASNIQGIFVPVAATCPSSGTLVGGTSSPDSYLMYGASALALMASDGIANASAAYLNANARFTGSCAATMQWCLAPN
jgi:hypothetical protein